MPLRAHRTRESGKQVQSERRREPRAAGLALALQVMAGRRSPDPRADLARGVVPDVLCPALDDARAAHEVEAVAAGVLYQGRVSRSKHAEGAETRTASGRSSAGRSIGRKWTSR